MAKPGISNGVAEGSRHTGLATKLRPRLRVNGGVADSISLRASGVVSEQRLFQVKNEKKKSSEVTLCSPQESTVTESNSPS